MSKENIGKTPEMTDEEAMKKINRFSRRELTAEEVYIFPVILCDNETDRDNERFSIDALHKLAQLFVGKTGIFDHNSKSSGQNSRIFDAQVITDENRLTSSGEPYTCIYARAYIMRSDKNADLIAEIDGGIKKEVSVSCSVEEEICSVCGKNRRKEVCSHRKGTVYGGKPCHVILNSPTDAYEFSFVAVPAQKNAGVTKQHGNADEQLKKQVSKLFYLCDTVLPSRVIKSIVESSDASELEVLRRSLEARLASRAEPRLVTELRVEASRKKCDISQFSIR